MRGALWGTEVRLQSPVSPEAQRTSLRFRRAHLFFRMPPSEESLQEEEAGFGGTLWTVSNLQRTEMSRRKAVCAGRTDDTHLHPVPRGVSKERQEALVRRRRPHLHLPMPAEAGFLQGRVSHPKGLHGCLSRLPNLRHREMLGQPDLPHERRNRPTPVHGMRRSRVPPLNQACLRLRRAHLPILVRLSSRGLPLRESANASASSALRFESHKSRRLQALEGPRQRQGKRKQRRQQQQKVKKAQKSAAGAGGTAEGGAPATASFNEASPAGFRHFAGGRPRRR